MSALVRMLFPAPTFRRDPVQIFRWWESRRPTYNAIVGLAGLVTLTAFELFIRIPFGMQAPFPWPAVLLYAAMANVCYTFGFIAESSLQRWLRRDTYGLGPALWRYGLVFSVGLTLVPIAVMGMGIASVILRAVLERL